MRTRPGRVEPGVYFRITHVGHQGAPVAACREQTVEIALGPKGAFENGNIGALTRQVRSDQVMSAVPPLGSKPKAPMMPKTPRVVELLRKAMEWQALLKAGKIPGQAEVARREGITRARVTHIMGMLRLAPEIQQRILSIPKMVSRSPISERMLRPIETVDFQNLSPPLS